ncbi:MAG: GNAT family N-acetyltransferase [Rickettsiales bacterium]|nr:GNAT family N-acetyltransferase [Rickettsiales bacterium]
MSIRPYTEKDFPSILSIYAKSKLDELRFENKVFTLLPLDQDQQRLQKLLQSTIYVYESDSNVIAYTAFTQSEITALFISPDYRGKGIGKELLEFVLKKLSGNITLNIAKSNKPAKQLYEQYGFKVIDEFKTEYNGVNVMANTMEYIDS